MGPADRQRLEAELLAKLRRAEKRYWSAVAGATAVYAEFNHLPLRDLAGYRARQEAQEKHAKALEEYSLVLKAFTELVVSGIPPPATLEE